MTPLVVTPVGARDPRIAPLLNALTEELARGGYTADQTFGYSVDQLEAGGVHLVGAWDTTDPARPVGIGGVEPGPDGVGELKRFYVVPERRGGGVADAVLDALVEHAAGRGVARLRLETGDEQHAAIAFYRRRGFSPIPRFGPYVDSATSYCMERPLGGRPRG